MIRTIAIWVTGLLASGLFGVVATSHFGPGTELQIAARAAFGMLPFAFTFTLLSPKSRSRDVALWLTGLPTNFVVAVIIAEAVPQVNVALEAGIAAAFAFAFFVLLAERETSERVGKLARVAAIWFTGLLASGLWGGLAGFLVSRRLEVFAVAGCVGGVMAFACVRLWLRERA